MHIGRTLIIRTFDKLARDITRHMSHIYIYICGRRKEKEEEGRARCAHLESGGESFDECSVNYSSGFKFPFDSFVQFMGGLRRVRCVV